MTVPLLLLVSGSYLLGATPTSHWVARGIWGVDLRTRGSGNLGATNTYRELGARAALPVLAFDVFKGWFPVWLVLGAGVAGGGTGVAVAAGGAALVGHVFSFWVGFRGGKGVATGAGVFLGLAPLAVAFVFVLWVGVVAATRYVSLGSILAAAVLPAVVWATTGRGVEGDLLPTAFASAVALFVLWAHRSNMGRLVRGEERRTGGPRSSERSPPAGSPPSPESGEPPAPPQGVGT
ncbi:MAG: glycerol-3-phosphate 1-O-acyltransferase [Gemmatimonadales bacterium]|nr:MAG: glycerol-3-phosphate 1-O-acyltransferase [Gemmatimonadales bacterium]